MHVVFILLISAYPDNCQNPGLLLSSQLMFLGNCASMDFSLMVNANWKPLPVSSWHSLFAYRHADTAFQCIGLLAMNMFCDLNSFGFCYPENLCLIPKYCWQSLVHIY